MRKPPPRSREAPKPVRAPAPKPSFPRLEAVDRRSGLTKEAFFAEYYNPGIPVIFTDVAARWPIVSMGLEALRDRLARLQGIARSERYGKLGDDGIHEVQSLDAWIDTTIDPDAPGLPPPYLGNVPFPDPLRELIDFPPGSSNAPTSPRPASGSVPPGRCRRSIATPTTTSSSR